jgi:hypothetical protein
MANAELENMDLSPITLDSSSRASVLLPSGCSMSSLEAPIKDSVSFVKKLPNFICLMYSIWCLASVLAPPCL